MDTFDPKDYEEKIVRPLRGKQPPDDLLPRYAVTLSMSDAELAQRLAQIRSHWNKGANSTAKQRFIRSVYTAFLRADEELKRDHGDQLNHIAWWREYQKRRAGARRKHVDELVRELRKNFGELGLITSGQLDSLRDTFPGLSDNEVDEALTTSGIRCESPIELPESSGMRDTHYTRLVRLLTDAEVASIPELVHGKLNGFRILKIFEAKPPVRDGLTVAALQEAIGRENKRSGNQAAREALGLVKTAVTKEGADLRQLALFHLIDDVRRHHHLNRAPGTVLVRRLRKSGLDDNEARQAVVSVLSETGTRTTASGLPLVRSLLEQGRLRAAQEALATVTGGEEAAEATGLVRSQTEKVRGLRESAHRALDSGADSEARRKLRQAASFAADDEEIAEVLAKIPLPRVLDCTAHPSGTGVRVSWRPSAEHDAETRYRVVRRLDRIPADPGDGDVVTEDTGTVAQDTTVPAGVPLGYAVFAAVPGGVWSQAEGVTIEVVPPVHAVRLSPGQNAIEATWSAHPDVVAVDVRRRDDDGTEIAVPATTTSFRDTTADPELAYTYTISVSYRLPDGTKASSDPVSVAHQPKPSRALPPVTELRYQRLAGDLVLSWVWPTDVRVVELSWTGPEPATARLTRQEYQEAGGFRLKDAATDLQITVCGVSGTGNRALRSAPSTLLVTAAPTRVRYTVSTRIKPLIGGGSARVRLTADQTVECPITVVIAAGRVMPLQPGDGQPLHQARYTLTAGETAELTVDIPRLRRPFWVRCFTGSDAVQLLDPPISELKVS